ncbi:MAG: lysophospholipase L1-like esterase [Saprospiraceae bacterium]|jgi:lysophospholipase L1-like esterase
MKNTSLVISLLINIVLIALFAFVLTKLGGARYVYFKMKNRGVAGVYMHRKNIFENLPKDSTDVVFLGDSLTEQCPWDELFPNVDLKNRAIGGEMTDGILDRLEVVTALTPKKLFLCIGVNDLLFHSPDYIVKNYEKILTNISQQSPSTKVFVQSLLPVNNDVRSTGVKNKDISEINHRLKKISKDKQLTFIDLHSKIATKEGLLPEQFTRDGIHLNGEAYLLWRNEIESFVIDN